MKAKQILTRQALHGLFEQVRGGSFTVTYNDGITERYGDGDPQFKISFLGDNLLDFLDGDMLTSFGEAYMDGRVDVEGDLADLLALALQSGLMSVTQKTQGFAGAALRAVGNLRSLSDAKENIAHHYDLGNDFFRLWLDESLTYSCAYFRNASDTIDEAQRQKIDHSLKKLRLQTGETLLDIGCGWGSLVIRAAEHYNVNATGITLSEEQHSGANAAIEERGLNDKASVDRELLRRLRAILHKAKTEGLDAQNREKLPHFRAWLQGMIAFVSMIRPDAGAKLKAAHDAVSGEAGAA